MHKTLLCIDAVINLVLGTLLLIYPQSLVEALGLVELRHRRTA